MPDATPHHSEDVRCGDHLKEEPAAAAAQGPCSSIKKI